MRLLKFNYTNWRGVDHLYVIEPEGIEYGPYSSGGRREGNPCRWVLHGMVVTRDGNARPEMTTRRRTFLLTEVRDLEEVSG